MQAQPSPSPLPNPIPPSNLLMPDQPDDDRDDRPADNRRSSDHHTRIGDSTVVDLKTMIMILVFAVGLATSWAEQRFALSAAKYELQAEITRVESIGDKRIGVLEAKLVQIQATNCAIARSLKVLTAECGRSEP